MRLNESYGDSDIMGKRKERKEARVGFFELLRELVKRIRNEILILAFALALISALVAITSQQFPAWIGITFILLYLIAVGCYLIQKTKKTSAELKEEASKPIFEWSIYCPPAFQSPTKIEPGLRFVRFDLRFTAKNLSDKTFLTKVWVKSSTQAIGFTLDSPVKRWKRRYGIIPYREELEITLDNIIEQTIPSNEEEDFTFHGLYRPLHALRDFQLKRTVLINYQILATAEEGRWIMDSGVKRIEIPFKDKVPYVKHE